MSNIILAPEFARTAFLAIFAAVISIGFFIGFTLPISAGYRAAHCELRAVTQSGDLFILGSGDSCQDAFINHAPIPSDYSRVWFERVQR